MTRYEAIEAELRYILAYPNIIEKIGSQLFDSAHAALALPAQANEEDSKTVNAELYGLAVKLCDRYMRSEIESLCVNNGFLGFILEARKPWYQDEVNEAARYLSLREASGEPMSYRVVRDGDKVRFE